MGTTELTPGSAAPTHGWRRDLGIALALALGFLAIAGPGLVEIATPVYDEVYTIPAAHDLVNGLPTIEQTHPPLSKLAMALGYAAVRGGPLALANDPWGTVALGARLPSLLVGAFGLVAIYCLVRAMGASRAGAALAGLLLGVDGLYFLFSRLALTNIYGVCFALWGTLGFWLAFRERRPAWLALAGAGYGLAMASRWSGVIGFGLCGLALVAAILAPGQRLGPPRRWALPVLGGLVALPVVLYVATYLPTMLSYCQGRWDRLLTPYPWIYLVALQQEMVRAHSGYVVPNPAASPWWSWPLMLRPAWYYFAYDRPADAVRGIFAVGNAAIWWVSVPAMTLAAWWAVRARDAAFGLLALLAAGLWLWWVPARAQMSLMHYMFESIPYVCAILALALDRWRAVMARPATIAAGAYAILAVGWLGFFHPLLVGSPISVDAYSAHLWLGRDQWDLGATLAAFRREHHLEDPAAFRAFNEKYYPNLGQYLKARPKR